MHLELAQDAVDSGLNLRGTTVNAEGRHTLRDVALHGPLGAFVGAHPEEGFLEGDTRRAWGPGRAGGEEKCKKGKAQKQR